MTEQSGPGRTIMKADLYVGLSLPFLSGEQYDALRKLSIDKPMAIQDSSYLWVFPIQVSDKITQIIGRSYKLDKEEAKIAVEYCPPLLEGVDKEKWKGKGQITILEFPKIYQVKEWIKDEFGEPKQTTQEVQKEDVVNVWGIIKEQPLDIYFPWFIVAGNICLKNNLNEYIKNGKFNKAEFFGRRRDYFKYFYYPVKVLEWFGVIEHHKRGKIKRRTDEFLIREVEVTHRLNEMNENENGIQEHKD